MILEICKQDTAYIAKKLKQIISAQVHQHQHVVQAKYKLRISLVLVQLVTQVHVQQRVHVHVTQMVSAGEHGVAGIGITVHVSLSQCVIRLTGILMVGVRQAVLSVATLTSTIFSVVE
jgi:hypothetical protein